jgi:hypothetical protein
MIFAQSEVNYPGPMMVIHVTWIRAPALCLSCRSHDSTGGIEIPDQNNPYPWYRTTVSGGISLPSDQEQGFRENATLNAAGINRGILILDHI